MLVHLVTLCLYTVYYLTVQDCSKTMHFSAFIIKRRVFLEPKLNLKDRKITHEYETADFISLESLLIQP